VKVLLDRSVRSLGVACAVVLIVGACGASVAPQAALANAGIAPEEFAALAKRA
jgi:hypothetical protein